MEQKLKISTITCHNVYNYGATLQEYALLHFLQSMGYDAQTINYKPPYLSGHFDLWKISNPSYNYFPVKYLYLLLKLPGRLKNLKRKKQFDKFEQNYIRTTNQLYRSNEEIKKNLPESDIYICGSDQIWNPVFSNGKDPAFYLDFVPGNKKKLSYAASIATDQIPDNLKAFVKEKVEHLDAISVRETSAVRILNQLGINDVSQVMDPVFLLDKNEWEKLIDTDQQFNEPYLLIYDADNNPNIKHLAQKMARKHNWKIYTLSPKLNYADQSFYLSGPDTFLALINKAEFIISNSFHAVAFSLIFQKQFVVFNRKENINTRMRDIVNLLGINNTLLAYDEKKDDVNYEIDYHKISKKINFHIDKSKDFLKNAITQ